MKTFIACCWVLVLLCQAATIVMYTMTIKNYDKTIANYDYWHCVEMEMRRGDPLKCVKPR
jgi:hypothetical protein